MPGIVSDVSAMLVATFFLLAAVQNKPLGLPGSLE